MNTPRKPAISVIASWDVEHRVWTATSEDVPGLFAQTGTFEEMMEVLPDLVADLLSFGQWPEPAHEPVPIEILARHTELVWPHEQ